jgi:hypothetical protein
VHKDGRRTITALFTASAKEEEEGEKTSILVSITNAEREACQGGTRYRLAFLLQIWTTCS